MSQSAAALTKGGAVITQHMWAIVSIKKKSTGGNKIQQVKPWVW